MISSYNVLYMYRLSQVVITPEIEAICLQFDILYFL